MKMTVEFNSLEEMNDFASRIFASEGGTDKATVSKPGIDAVEKAKATKTKKADKKPVSEETTTQDNASEKIPFDEDSKAEAAAEDKQFSLEEVRAKLAELLRSGKGEKVKDLLKSFGVDRVTDLDPKNYVAFMEKAGEI